MSNDDLTIAPGDVVLGKYQVERVVGAGGMGRVLAARHVQLGEQVAIKVLLPEHAGRTDVVARFLREAQAASRIKSEHVARVMDVGTLDGGAPYMVMEYLEGRDLGEEIALAGAVRVDDAIEYVLQACEAIAEAHALGIVHRDLKPSNLFLSRTPSGAPRVKVLDFGIAKAIDPGGTQLTASATALGSPSYMSPEQIRDAHQVDARTDVWALGVTLFELVSGQVPFDGPNAHSVLARIVTDPAPSLLTLRPHAPAELDAVLQRCLVKDPAGRIGSIGELARALAPLAPPRAQISLEHIAAIAGIQVPSARTPMASRSPATDDTVLAPPASSSRNAMVIAALAVGVLVVAGAVAMKPRGNGPPATREAPPAASPPAPVASPAASSAPPVIEPAPPPSPSATASTTARPSKPPPPPPKPPAGGGVLDTRKF
jgi:serine/threonine-protein kinase